MHDMPYPLQHLFSSCLTETHLISACWILGNCMYYWATVCKTARPMLSDRCPVCPVCDVRALWPNGWTDQDETGMQAGRARPWPHCVRWGPSSPPLKGHSPTNFRPISAAAKWLHYIDQDVTWYGGRPRPRRLCVRWGPHSPSPKGGLL